MDFEIVDPGSVHLIGENSVLRLKADADQEDLSLCSFWRVLDSPAGPGHTLFLRSISIENGAVSIYSDNEKLTRLLQGLEHLMRPFFADTGQVLRPGRFERTQSGRESYRETIGSGPTRIELEWRDLQTPFMTRLKPNNSAVGHWSVYSCLVPAASASLVVDGVAASGRAFPEIFEGLPTSTSFLALGEIWLDPKPSQTAVEQ